MSRRTFLKYTGAGIVTAGLGAAGLPVAAQGLTKVKLGYLHTIAVDGQLWIGQHFGHFAKHGVEFELHRFVTGLELFQAMIGGSIDMLATGAVISNFPARGQGKMFLVNDVEYATAQLWVHTGQGIHSLKDLVGKTIATTTGTTAHVFLDTSLARLRFAASWTSRCYRARRRSCRVARSLRCQAQRVSHERDRTVTIAQGKIHHKAKKAKYA